MVLHVEDEPPGPLVGQVAAVPDPLGRGGISRQSGPGHGPLELAVALWVFLVEAVGAQGAKLQDRFLAGPGEGKRRLDQVRREGPVRVHRHGPELHDPIDPSRMGDGVLHHHLAQVRVADQRGPRDAEPIADGFEVVDVPLQGQERAVGHAP